jgi:hypothetical protein
MKIIYVLEYFFFYHFAILNGTADVIFDFKNAPHVVMFARIRGSKQLDVFGESNMPVSIEI